MYRVEVRGKTAYRAEIQYTDADGIVQRRSAQRSTEAEAMVVLRNWRAEVHAEKAIAKNRQRTGPTFKGYSKKWLLIRKPEIGANTYRQYEGNLRLHLVPFFGDRPLAKINQQVVATFLGSFESARDEGARKHETGEVTRRQCLMVLKLIFSDAVADGAIEKIPFTITGHQSVKMRVERREMNVLDLAEQRSFLKAAVGQRLEALLILAVASGMREGELLGLRWANVKNDHINVQRRLDSRTNAIAQTKSRSGVRRIDLDPVTMNALNLHKTRMESEGQGTGSRDLVFVISTGKPISASSLIKYVFRPVLTTAEITKALRFHDLRHSHATLLLSSGVNPKVVQERLGHENVRTTLDLYGHVLPTSQRECASIIGNALFGVSSLIISLTNDLGKVA